MNRWISNHKWVVFSIYYVLIFIFFFIAGYNFESNIFWYIFGFMFSLIVVRYINSSSLKELNRAVKYLDDDCDPDKYLEIVNEIYDHNKRKAFRAVISIDKALALSSLGKYQENLELLKSIDIDRFHLQIETKIVYYNNLAGAYFLVNDIENGSLILEKAKQMIADPKANFKRKFLLEKSLELNSIYILLSENRIEEAEKVAYDNLLLCDSKRFIVTINDTLAEIYLKQDRIDEAKECLKYVAENGNKLFIAQNAKRLLNTL